MEFDSNDSPIIRLSAPHTNITITPPRYSDGEAVISMLSDPRVYMNLAGPPYPYARKEWDEWFPIIEKGSHDALLDWREAEKSRKDGGYGKRWVKGAPVIAIRDVDPVTREQKLIGIIGVARMDFMIKAANDENKRRQEVNEALDAGDPEIVWELGFYLAPSHHGRGIMPATIRALIHDFMIPYMNAYVIAGSYFQHNAGSRKVFEKNGFVFEGVIPDCFELPESKTGVKGKKASVGFMRWTRSPQSSNVRNRIAIVRFVPPNGLLD